MYGTLNDGKPFQVEPWTYTQSKKNIVIIVTFIILLNNNNNNNETFYKFTSIHFMNVLTLCVICLCVVVFTQAKSVTFLRER